MKEFAGGLEELHLNLEKKEPGSFSPRLITLLKGRVDRDSIPKMVYSVFKGMGDLLSWLYRALEQVYTYYEEVDGGVASLEVALYAGETLATLGARFSGSLLKPLLGPMGVAPEFFDQITGALSGVSRLGDKIGELTSYLPPTEDMKKIMGVIEKLLGEVPSNPGDKNYEGSLGGFLKELKE